MDNNLIWNKAGDYSPLLILAHGAGAGMDSAFMVTMATLLCERNITVVRFNFPYMQQQQATGRKRPPDRKPKLIECWNEVIKQVKTRSSAPIFIGGKSMGGRIATMLEPDTMSKLLVSGVICIGYPFYGAGKQDNPRIEHLKTVLLPHLIIQGDRDTMGNITTVLTYPLSKLIDIYWLKDGSHDLCPRKSSGLTHNQHLDKAAEVISNFIHDKQNRYTY
ncbi:MAG: alpha/beta hydrolase [Candidatus Endonucleobacter bathymodioli]|uniref:Alpha/beta hydrolase n=1 Tax=Candidatus Endonucleibacter bathymodioli TaxID=539814 RepID=A0AA90SM50_9GAMM|nr:alpha/beta hydrolase [Candidatus Endonucleobacter bathymodioli]